MPTTTYMVVDPRHDHSFRIPRPDRTVALGVPNACNGCHAKQSPQWAAAAVAKWFPQPKRGFQTFAEALHAAERGAPEAQGALIRVAEDRDQSGFVRAGAVERLGRYLSPVTLPTVRNALNDSDPLVRAAAARALANADVPTRAQLLPRMLDDPIRQVRLDAARSLAGPPEARLTADDRTKLARALDEYVTAQRFNADRPESQLVLGALERDARPDERGDRGLSRRAGPRPHLRCGGAQPRRRAARGRPRRRSGADPARGAEARAAVGAGASRARARAGAPEAHPGGARGACSRREARARRCAFRLCIRHRALRHGQAAGSAQDARRRARPPSLRPRDPVRARDLRARRREPGGRARARAPVARAGAGEPELRAARSPARGPRSSPAFR